MDLTPHVAGLRHELAVAADAGGPDARALAERLTAALESSARLTLLSALSAAAEEITRDLAPGSVEVRLRGTDPEFAVSPPPAPEAAESPADRRPLPPVPSEGDESGMARVNLRLPAHLKARIEEAAGQEGLSVNAWLGRAVAAALEPGGVPALPPRPSTARGRKGHTGWVR